MRKVYFGNATKQLWINAPQTGMSASSAGWVNETKLLSGQTNIRRSQGSHRRFEMNWLGSLNAPALEDSLNVIKDFADGLYGNGPFFWNDPYAVESNILPPNWAAPMLIEKDWFNFASGLTPTYTTAAVNNNYPSKYATFTTTGAYTSTTKLTLIIPTGYRLYFGWHGPTGGSDTGIRIIPYKRSDGTADTALNPNRITAGGAIRTNTNISGTTYSRVEILVAAAGAATINVTGMIAQILPESTSPASGGFISGRGTTGLEFAEFPQIEYYSANLNNGQVGMSASLVEV
jgi:hypothetical protein